MYLHRNCIFRTEFYEYLHVTAQSPNLFSNFTVINNPVADPGGTPGVCPLMVPILSFWHTTCTKCSRVGSWCPTSTGKSWIRHWLVVLNFVRLTCFLGRWWWRAEVALRSLQYTCTGPDGLCTCWPPSHPCWTTSCTHTPCSICRLHSNIIHYCVTSEITEGFEFTMILLTFTEWHNQLMSWNHYSVCNQ